MVWVLFEAWVLGLVLETVWSLRDGWGEAWVSLGKPREEADIYCETGHSLERVILKA